MSGPSEGSSLNSLSHRAAAATATISVQSGHTLGSAPRTLVSGVGLDAARPPAVSTLVVIDILTSRRCRNPPHIRVALRDHCSLINALACSHRHRFRIPPFFPLPSCVASILFRPALSRSRRVHERNVPEVLQAMQGRSLIRMRCARCMLASTHADMCQTMD
jgi:hypothetical protein